MTRYDAQWIDVLDAEMWAAVRRMSVASARARRAATFFLGAWRAGR
jgi:hypothetical protein